MTPPTYTKRETLQDLQAAVQSGKRVYWHDTGYELIQDSVGQWLVICAWNKHCAGLYWSDGKRSDYRASDFIVAE